MRKYCGFDDIGIPLTSNYYHKLKNIGFQKHKNVVYSERESSEASFNS